MTRKRPALLTIVLVALAAMPTLAGADEGMWLFNEFPFQRFAAAYGYRPTSDWLDHVRLASVRFNNGGSGSFVSPDGLVITNHHVGADCIQKLSSADHDYMASGFAAADRAGEQPCPDLELNVLASIERVTDRVEAGVGAQANAEAANEARRAAIAAIEKECHEKTGLRCDVVTLFAGGEYDLYRYRRYTDVRLAFAPEFQLAFFGGDPDNFEYPRWDVDFALFRVYEKGAPIHVENYLPWGVDGPREGEVTFVSGNPGSTARLETFAQLELLRNTVYPFRLARFGTRREEELRFAARGEEERRISERDLFGIDNAIKAYSGYVSGLLDDDLMAAKRKDEEDLREAVAAHPDLARTTGDPWGEIAAAVELDRSIAARYDLLEGAPSRGRAGRLAEIAFDIVRLAAQQALPNGERLPEYRESALPSLEQDLYSSAPIYPDYEEFRLAAWLHALRAQLGPVHPLVVATFGDATPEEIAHRAVAGTALAEVAARRALVASGAAGLAASDDPLVTLMKGLEPAAYELRRIDEDRITAVEEQAGARITRALRAAATETIYPDATFTLRLSYGKAIGYREGDREIPWQTTISGLFRHSEEHGGRPPYELATALAAARDRLDGDLPVDFVTTNDIIGGNSGSPVIDRQGRFVGIVFDGNLQMLPNRFHYSSEQARAIAVDARVILAALQTLYPRGSWLADELLRASSRRP